MSNLDVPPNVRYWGSERVLAGTAGLVPDLVCASQVGVQRCHDLGALADRAVADEDPSSGTSRRRSVRGRHRCFHVPCRLAVSEARLALPNFYNITIRIANVAARLAVLVLWLCDKLGSSISP